MNNANDAMPLNPAVSTALAGWLALNPPERRTLHHAISALEALGHEARNDRASAPPAPSAPPDPLAWQPGVKPSRSPITLDALPEIDRDLFGSASYRNLGRSETIAIYVAGSLGTLALAQGLGFQVFKLGFSRDLGIEARIAQLCQIQYASCWRDDTAIVEEPKFGSWQHKSLQVDDARPVNSPVRLLPAGLAVDLSRGIGAEAFDRDLMLALDARAIDRFSTTEAGRAHCEQRALDPAQLRRLTRRGHSHQPAQELSRFTPRLEAPRLVQLIEALVARSASTLLEPCG